MGYGDVNLEERGWAKEMSWEEGRRATEMSPAGSIGGCRDVQGGCREMSTAGG